MNNNLLTILCLEDDARDAEIINELMIDAGYSVKIDHVSTQKEFIKSLSDNKYDAILSDFSLPGFNAFGALRLSKEISPETPFICVSGSIGEETAIQLLREGAVDYILKDRLVRLPFAIKRALEEIKEKEIRRKAEAELHVSERRFQTLAEVSPVGIFQTDAKGLTTYVNPRWCQISGLTFEEAMNNNWIKAVHKDDREKLMAGWINATESSLPSYAEYRFVLNDGTIAWVMGQAIPEKNMKNEIVGYVGTITDITELKRTEEELIRARDKAEEMNKLKSNFLANMSHELRTPLVGIIGLSQVLNEELNDSDGKRYSKLILESGIRLRDTLNLILDLSKIESETLQLYPEEIEMTEYVSSLARVFEKTAEAKKIKLTIKSEDELLFANLDKVLLNSVINNLMNNAIKYTFEGFVNVDIKKIIEDGQYIEISIRDSGIGIAEKNLSVIFEPFRQISEGWNRNFEGTGLGLTIVKEYLNKMSGSIIVESQIGVGSTFKVRFPLVRTKMSDNSRIEIVNETAWNVNKSVKNVLEKSKTNKPLVLYVEDDNISQKVIETILEKKFTVESIDDCDQVIGLVKNKHFDLILMDINLKGKLNGLDLAKEIKKFDEYASTPIIAITAYAMVGDKEKMLDGGCTHYLSKPFSRNELIELLDEIIINHLEKN
ncbi:MAG: response regulator [Ignavibacteriales bacterium]|nr:MAG: response regulator [Ignavibacteriales bacterium]